MIYHANCGGIITPKATFTDDRATHSYNMEFSYVCDICKRNDITDAELMIGDPGIGVHMGVA
jgi:hypothetical protein